MKFTHLTILSAQNNIVFTIYILLCNKSLEIISREKISMKFYLP